MHQPNSNPNVATTQLEWSDSRCRLSLYPGPPPGPYLRNWILSVVPPGPIMSTSPAPAKSAAAVVPQSPDTRPA
eukprot:g74393.t1